MALLIYNLCLRREKSLSNPPSDFNEDQKERPTDFSNEFELLIIPCAGTGGSTTFQDVDYG